MEKVKSFNVAKAIELLRKTNQPRADVKKNTKFDNMLALFNALIAQDGRCIIYQRKAFAKIIGVSEATFRHYLTKLGVEKFKLIDVVVNGKDGEEVVMMGTDKVDTTIISPTSESDNKTVQQDSVDVKPQLRTNTKPTVNQNKNPTEIAKQSTDTQNKALKM